MKKTENERCALIVGAGAVQNAWKPVLRALQPSFPMPLTADGANTHLARMVYLLRWWSGVDTVPGRKILSETLAHFNEVKATIASEIIFSQKTGELAARDVLTAIVDKFIVPTAGRFILLSTNWDTAVETAIHAHLDRDYRCAVNPIHIHGRTENPQLMYFPTEVTKEPYRLKNEDDAIGALHGTAWRTLETATRAIVYGLSLTPLDAELCQILACGWASKRLREIIVINPNHEEVAHRVNVLLDPRFPVSVIGMSPDDLDHRLDYTASKPSNKISRGSR
jgi:hypothetical protein